MNTLQVLSVITCVMIVLFVLCLSVPAYIQEYKYYKSERDPQDDQSPHLENEENEENGVNRDVKADDGTGTHGDPPSSRQGITCRPGECVTDITTGLKRCPADDAQLYFDPVRETCNAPFTCSSNRTPYAMDENFATLSSRHCNKGIMCFCKSKPQCQTDLSSVFIVSGTDADPSVVSVVNDDNLYVPPSSTLLCQLPGQLASRGLQCTAGTADQIFDCFNGGHAQYKCIKGVVAQITDRGHDKFGMKELVCLDRSQCPDGKLLHYDVVSSKSMCLNKGETGTGAPITY